MMEKILEKIVDRSPLVFVFIGILMFIFGAIGEFSIGSQIIKVSDPRWQLGSGLIGGIMVLTGLLLSWKESQSPKNKGIGATANFYGGLDKVTRNDNNFQDFKITRPGGNINAVHYLWADTYKASTINAHIDNDDHFLRIEFNNKPGSYASNLAIRPYAEQALQNTHTKAYLTFEARIPPKYSKPSMSDSVAVGVRVVNGWNQHWEYSDKPGEYIQFPIKDSKWKKFQVDLSSSHWNRFQGDGNRFSGPANAEFKIISAVVFEVGSHNVPGRPGAGSGVLDIREIKIEEHS